MNDITLTEARERLDAAKSVLLLTHMRPDADTLGSAAALCGMLKQLGKSCEILCGDKVPKRLAFLAGEDLSPAHLPGDFLPDLIVSVDVSSPELLGSLADGLAKKVGLAIDHHARGTRFAKESYVETLGACGEIIFDLAVLWEEDGKKVLTKEVAEALYAAIASDTGRFQYEAVTPKTHLRIAGLLTVGIDHAEIARRLFEEQSPGELRAMKMAYQLLHTYLDGKLAVINVSAETLAEYQLTKDDISDVISVARSGEGVEAAVTIREEEGNKYKVSLRTARLLDASAICAIFGGGGHKRAAGCTLSALSEYDAEAMIVAAITEAFAAAEEV